MINRKAVLGVVATTVFGLGAFGAFSLINAQCGECKSSLVEGLTDEDITISRTFDQSPQFMVGRGLSAGDKISDIDSMGLNGKRTIVYYAKVGCSICVIAETAIYKAMANSKDQVLWLIVGTAEPDESYVKTLQQGLPSDRVRVAPQETKFGLLEKIDTKAAPTIALINESGILEAMWRGFDPARGEEVAQAIQDFTLAKPLTPTAGLSWAGQKVAQLDQEPPQLPLNNWSSFGTNTRTLVYVTDDFVNLATGLIGKGIDVRVIDISASDAITAKRLAYVNRYAPTQATSIRMSEASKKQEVDLVFPTGFKVYKDPQSLTSMAWANDLTPNVYVFGQDGTLERVVPYRGATTTRPFLRSVEVAALGIK
jgi:hypothetical protein